jgi:hypothetical protein
MVHGVFANSGTGSLGQGSRDTTATTVTMGLVHGVAGVVGGAAIAMLVWTFTIPLHTLLPLSASLAIFSSFALFAIAADLELVRLPSRHKQVPQSWYGVYGPLRSYAYYGLILGGGLLTEIPFAVTYSIFAAALILPLPDAVLLGALFGLGRTGIVGPINAHHRLVQAMTRSYPWAQAHLRWISAVASATFVVFVLLRP